MKIALMLVMTVHASIHVLGLIKAFRLLPLPQLPVALSPAMGLLWLLAAVAILVSGLLMLMAWKLWWLVALIAVILSQSLIFHAGHEARWGTLPNTFILVAVLIGWGFWNFDRTWEHLRTKLLASSTGQESHKLITDAALRDLPSPVQKWLRWSQIIERPQLKAVHLLQRGRMRLNPEQGEWLDSRSEQWIVTRSPSFIWKVATAMKGLPILGFDTFREGKGSMKISLLGLWPVVHVADNPKINQSALQRFLGEIIWIPSAALDPSIVWKERDEESAVATMTWAGTQGSAVFYFRPDGEPYRFVAQRFKDIGDAKPMEWVADILSSREFKGLKLPSRVKATWMLPSGPFTWYEFEVMDANFQSMLSLHEK